jgi:hypothetical protein
MRSNKTHKRRKSEVEIMTIVETEQITQEILMTQSKISSRQKELNEIFKKAGVDRV